MLTSLMRVIKSGWQGFRRNRWLSATAIAMMSLTIFGITGLLMANVLIDSFARNLENRIDVSVYFELDASEERILEAKNNLLRLPEIKTVEYVSAGEALEKFKEKHRGNPVLMQSLRELDDNPLRPSLNVKTQTASQYEAIVNFFNQAKYKETVNKINYYENKEMIDRLAFIAQTIRQGGFVILIVLALMAVLVTFSTISLAIYNAKKEIKVMKLVGASNWFVRGPFIVEGTLYGLAAGLITFLVFYPVLWYLSPKLFAYLSGVDLFQFYRTNFFWLLLTQVAVGVVLGAASSFIAIRKHLKA